MIKPLTDLDNSEDSAAKDEDVNDIILKIEMKKFHKLIQNRVQHKNTLLKADITRLYPICSYKANHSPTNVSDLYQVLSPTSPSEPKKSLLSDRNLKSRGPALQNLKDISLPGLHSGIRSSRNTYKS